jgi:flagellar hook assembly protein FlgD
MKTQMIQFNKVEELIKNKKEINNLLKELKNNKKYTQVRGYYQVEFDSNDYNLIFLGDNEYPVQVYNKQKNITFNTNNLEILKGII